MPQETSDSDTPKWHILVVDDEEDVHLVTRLALKHREWRKRGFAIYSSMSAEEAKKQLAEHPPGFFHVAMVDVVMETDTAGLELCRYIRETCPTSLRIVLRTGQAGVAPEEYVLNEYDVDHYLLNGVPNTAFTEAIAFVFQNRDMELLGLASEDKDTAALKKLDDFWSVYEIAGVALVDMAVWHWMYDNPDAAPAQLKEAVLTISKDIWNKYYAPVFGHDDVPLLAIYSHMINNFLYLPNYPVGHLIAVQIEEQVQQSGDLGGEIERMCKLGNIAPDLWMKQATGSPVGADALLRSTEEALEVLQ